MSKMRFKVGQRLAITDAAGQTVKGTVAIVVVRARLVAIQFPNRPDPMWFNFSEFKTVAA